MDQTSPGETFRVLKEKKEKQYGNTTPAAWFWKYMSEELNFKY
jgi:hypothetical protein